MSKTENFLSLLATYTDSIKKSSPKKTNMANAIALKTMFINVLGQLERSFSSKLDPNAYAFLENAFSKPMFALGYDDSPEKIRQELRDILKGELDIQDKRALHTAIKEAVNTMRAFG